MLKPDVLAMLRCPEDQSTLALAGEALVDELNQAIRRRQVRNRAGRVLEKLLDGGLVPAGGSVIYPIVDGIPMLVRDEAIELKSLAHGGNGAPAERPGE